MGALFVTRGKALCLTKVCLPGGGGGAAIC